jgi:hypothetical protein
MNHSNELLDCTVSHPQNMDLHTRKTVILHVVNRVLEENHQQSACLCVTWFTCGDLCYSEQLICQRLGTNRIVFGAYISVSPTASNSRTAAVSLDAGCFSFLVQHNLCYQILLKLCSINA